MKKTVFWLTHIPTIFVWLSLIPLNSGWGQTFVIGIFLIGLSLPFYFIFLPLHIWNTYRAFKKIIFYNQVERLALIITLLTISVSVFYVLLFIALDGAHY